MLAGWGCSSASLLQRMGTAGNRSSCSFRQIGVAPDSTRSKRFYNASSSEKEDNLPGAAPAKRKRTGDSWYPLPTAQEEERFGLHPLPSSVILNNALLFGTFRTDIPTAVDQCQKDNSSSAATSSSSDCPETATQNYSGNTQPVEEENKGLEILHLLTSCAEAIAGGDCTSVDYWLGRLGELVSPGSRSCSSSSSNNSSIHRLSAYFTEALAIRAVKHWPQIFSITPPRRLNQDNDDDALALRLLNNVSPIPMFIHFTLNHRLARAFEGKERVHIIDFDIKEGLQWPGLLQALASSPTPPAQIRITGVGDSKQELHDTESRLSALAEALNLRLEFHPVVDRPEDVRLWMLHVKEGECVAVNCMLQLHKLLHDETGAKVRSFLGLLRSANPRIVLLAEEETEHNGPRWEARFARSLKYYAAVFDSVEASLPEGSAARARIEEMFGRRIRNVVACDGADRVERHQGFKRWAGTMEAGGFCSAGIGAPEVLQSSLILRMFSCKNYSLEEEGDARGLTLKWCDQPLYTVSAWEPSPDAAIAAGGLSESEQG